jgi:hypothetical protein
LATPESPSSITAVSSQSQFFISGLRSVISSECTLSLLQVVRVEIKDFGFEKTKSWPKKYYRDYGWSISDEVTHLVFLLVVSDRQEDLIPVYFFWSWHMRWQSNRKRWQSMEWNTRRIDLE